jgi:hypothetical protein
MLQRYILRNIRTSAFIGMLFDAEGQCRNHTVRYYFVVSFLVVTFGCRNHIARYQSLCLVLAEGKVHFAFRTNLLVLPTDEEKIMASSNEKIATN